MLYGIREELCDLKWRCEGMQMFDASQKLLDLHHYNETLIKIGSGKYDTKELQSFKNDSALYDDQDDTFNGSFNNNVVITYEVKKPKGKRSKK
jgi:hypothetical protein